jgi:hypothetical protein
MEHPSPTSMSEKGAHLPLVLRVQFRWTLVVAMVALGLASMICFPLSGSNFKLEPAFESEAFNLATNDYFEQHSSVLYQGFYGIHTTFQCLSSSSHYPSLFVAWMVCLGGPSFLCPLLCGLGIHFPCFCYEEFIDPNSHFFCLNFCSILMAYQ